jgi:alpha-aminoadipic semialdehyde synthase
MADTTRDGTPARIGLRREDKNEWERRVPLVPADVETLVRRHGIACSVQPFPRRAFPDEAYRDAGALVDEDLENCPVVLGVKEMPPALFREGYTYMFFAHVIKGQAYNMDMLRALMEKKCNLVDYERIVDENGKRLIFFGRHAGLAGMIDSLWALGERLAWEGTPTPFRSIRKAHEYGSLDEAVDAVRKAGEAVRTHGLPEALAPLVCGFAGYGNVSVGAQEIFDLLPAREVSPDALPGPGEGSRHEVIKVVFREEHLVAPRETGKPFELQEYYAHPDRFEPRFERFLPGLTLLVNAVYWDDRYPRLVTKEALRTLFAPGKTPRLRVIGDVSADVEGAVEATVRCTDPGNPVFVFDPATGSEADGVAGPGPVILAVDNLPAELPREASEDFSAVLRDFVPALAAVDFGADDPALPAPLKKALILHRGELTPAYRYLEKHLE